MTTPSPGISEGQFATLADAVISGNSPEALRLVKRLCEAGMSRQQILEQALVPAMSVVGKKFREFEFFVPEVLIAARAMRGCVDHVHSLPSKAPLQYVGKAVIGTVKGDLHDIGKDIVKNMMEGKGVEVVDLGVDVPAEDFLERTAKDGADLLCMSSLLTTTKPQMRTVMEHLTNCPDLDHVKVLVGGAPVTEEYADAIGADGYAEEADSGSSMAVRLLRSEGDPVRVRRRWRSAPSSVRAVEAATFHSVADRAVNCPVSDALSHPSLPDAQLERPKPSRPIGFERVLETAPENIVVLDTGLRLLYANHVAEREIQKIWGREQAWEGRKCHEVYCSSARVCLNCPARDAIQIALDNPAQASKVRVHRVIDMTHSVLGQMSLDISAIPLLDANGVPEMVVVTRRDETLRTALAKIAATFQDVGNERQLVERIAVSGIEAGSYETQMWKRRGRTDDRFDLLAHAVFQKGETQTVSPASSIRLEPQYLDRFRRGQYCWVVGNKIQTDKLPDLRDYIRKRGEEVTTSPLFPDADVRPRAIVIHFPLRVWEDLWGVAVVSYDLGQRILITGQLETLATLVDLVQNQVVRFMEEKHRLDQLQSVLHNAKKPVNAVMGLVALLKEAPLGSRRTHLADTARSALALASTKLAGLAKVWHDRSESLVHAQMIDCDLRELAQQILDLFAWQAKDEGVEFLLECDFPRAMTCSDPENLQLILMELIDNSLRWFPSATKDRRVIVEITPSSEPKAWDLFVSDNGSGFDEHTRQRAFEVKPSTGRSSGLGLPSVGLLVASLEGRIEVLAHPRLGTGTSIAIHLPAGARYAQDLDR